MALQLRALRGDDLFLLLDIFGKLDIADELASMFSGAGVNADNLKKKSKAEIETETRKIGADVLAKLAKKALSNITLVKTELNALLAQLAGVDVAEIQNLSLIDYLNGVTAIFKDPQIKDFFSSISTSLT